MGYQRRVHGDFGPVFTFDSSERAERQSPQHKMAELGLKKREVDAIDFAFDVYDFKGDGKVDAFYLGDLVRACNLNPTLKTIAEIGGQTEKGKKVLSKAECYPAYKAAKDSKDQGKSLMKELCDPEDEDGFIPFKPFLEKMCAAEKKIKSDRGQTGHKFKKFSI